MKLNNSQATLPTDKILRIGVIQAGKIVEEKLMRQHGPVTIGASPRNLIVVPASSLPRSFTLFDYSGGRYTLVFGAETDGRISLDGNVMTLAKARDEQVAKRGRGDLYRLVLNEESRGKVVLGDIVLLFQFVSRPPVQPRPQLPPSVRGSLITTIDWTLAISYLATAAVLMSFLIYLNSLDLPRHIEPDIIPDNFARYLPTVQKPELLDLKKVVEEVGEEKIEKKDEAKETGSRKARQEKAEPVCDEECQAQRAAARRARILEQVSKLGALKLLGTTGQGTGAVNNLLAGGDPGAAADKAFEDVGGLSVTGSSGDLRGVGGGGSGERVDIGNLGGRISGPGAVQTGGMVQEKVPKAVLKTADPEVDGSLQVDAVARVIRQGMAAVRSCYQRALKQNPKLAGKVTIRLTISPTGRVTSVDFDTDTLGDASVTACIQGYAARWRFPPPEGGETAEISVPFIFQASGG